MKLILTFLLSVSVALVEHDVPVATFNIYLEADALKLDVNFDARDLARELDVKPAEITAEMVETYLNEHTEFSFDGEQKTISVKDLKKKRGHLIAQSVFNTDILEFTNIVVRNTCFLEMEEQSNVIEIRLNGHERGFRMHKGRTSIEVKL